MEFLRGILLAWPRSPGVALRWRPCPNSSRLHYSRIWNIVKGMPPRIEDAPAPEDFLPLHRDTFQILVSLADRDRHGYSILLDIAERTGGRSITPSTLYSSIRRLLESGLIEELSERPDPDQDDERRRYYRLTSLGRRVAGLEARRLERLLRDARTSGLLPKRT